MRILVLSDSHGDSLSMRTAIRSNSPDAVIFLGDGIRDWEENLPFIMCKKTAAVRGNCDFYADNYPLKTIEDFGNISVYCTHGHSEGVKYGLDTLTKCALEAHAKIAVYGHTHIPFSSYRDGLYILNPGSVRQNSCGIIEITPQGILCFSKNIVTEIPHN